MNFKRFGRTANLFDKDNATAYDCYITSNGQWATGAGNKTVRIPCDSNTQYTLSTASTYSAFRIMETNSDSIPSDGSPVSGTLIYYGSGNAYTFTTSNTAKYIIFQANSALLSQWLSELMFNLGSTPLPYEPYSSEVWHDIPHYIHNTSTDTITTLPADIYVNDTTATVGLKGNMYQASGVSPTTPITPSECGERTGNLWTNPNTWTNDVTDTRTFFQPHIALYSGNTSLGYVRKDIKTDGHNFLVSVTPNADFDRVYVKHNGSTRDLLIANIYGNLKANTPVTLSFDVNGHDPTTVGGINISNIMLNTGSTPLPYEPYGYKIPISSASTTTPVYLGEVESTRQIKKLVLTGQEIGWTKASSSRVFYILSDFGALNTANVVSCMCSHYESQGNVSSVSGVSDLKCCFRTTSQTLYIHDDAFESNSDFVYYLQQQYAAGTPVCVWYVLATSTTGIVNEPIRKIGDYADTVSGITIPTIAGADSFDVETTLKPSEVSLTYTGWHDASVKEWDSSEWQ